MWLRGFSYPTIDYDTLCDSDVDCIHAILTRMVVATMHNIFAIDELMIHVRVYVIHKIMMYMEVAS